MSEEHYLAASYRMRNEAAWLVREDRGDRVVVMSLSEGHARRLAEVLNVATLAAEVIDYGEGKPVGRRSSRSTIRRSLP